MLTISVSATSGTATFTLTPTDDNIFEPDEAVTVTGGVNASSLAVVGTAVTIENDEVASTSVALTVSPDAIAEGAGATSVTVTAALNNATQATDTVVTLTVGVPEDTASEGTDYAAVADLMLTIFAGMTSGTATFTLTPTDDEVAEPDEVVTVAGMADVESLAVTGATVTIEDDEMESLSVALTVLPDTIAEDAGATTVTVTGELNNSARTVETVMTLTVGVSEDTAIEGTDYAAVSDLMLTISAGMTSGTATFTLTPTDDGVAESDETVTVTAEVESLVVMATAVTIEDDEVASTSVALTVSPDTIAEGAGATSVTVTGELDNAAQVTDAVVTLTVGVSEDTAIEGTDYASVGDLMLTISMGATSGTATFTLTPIDDNIFEPDETVAVAGTTDMEGLTVATATVTIEDDEVASTSVALTVSPDTIAEDAGATSVTVTGALNNTAQATDAVVTLTVGVPEDTAIEGTDYALVSDLMLTISAGMMSGTATFALTPTNDNVVEPDETVTVAGTTGMEGLTVATATVTIEDDDLEVMFGADMYVAHEGGLAATVTVTLTPAASSSLTIPVKKNNLGGATELDYSGVPLSLTFEAGEMDKSFTVTAVDDTVDDDGESVQLSFGVLPPGVMAGTPTKATVTIEDDDEPASIDDPRDDDPEDDDPQTPDDETELPLPELEPLTARFANVPADHDGASAFHVEVIFSEALAAGSLPNLVSRFTVSGGAMMQARRADTGHLQWEVVFEPFSHEAVTVSLVGGGVCGSGAVCTEDGRAFSGSISATIVGPPGVSVADAEVAEGPHATLDFSVMLSHAASRTVTVDYATSGGTATEGEDYTAASGTLTFAPADLSKTVSVSVLDDMHDETAETLTFVLSNPLGTYLEDGSAIGTIIDSDPMPQAWLVRFGRTVADQVLMAIEERMTGGRAPGVEISLAGQRVGGDAELQVPETRDAAARLEAFTAWLRGEEDEDAAPAAGLHEVTGSQLLSGSSFVLTGEMAGGGFGALWGRGAISHFDGREDGLRLDGRVRSAMIGADFTSGNTTVGLALSHSRGKGGYDAQSGGGEIEATLTGAYPWGRYEMGEHLSVWAMGGYGEGRLRLMLEGMTAIKTDIDLEMVAVGGRGVLTEASEEVGFELAVKSDALLLRTTSDEVQDETGSLAASDATVTRFRLGLEGTWHGLKVGTSSFLPSLEIGVRHDEGDAEKGFGADIGGGIVWTDPLNGIEMSLHARGLLTHEDGGFREHGFAGSLVWDPDWFSDRGPKLTLSQRMGASATGGMDELLGQATTQVFGAADDRGREFRRHTLEATLGYGFPALGGRYTEIPEVGIRLSETSREWIYRWRLVETRRARSAFEINFEMARLQSLHDEAAPEYSMGFWMTARW